MYITYTYLIVIVVVISWASHTRYFPLAEFIRGLGVT